MWGILNMKAAGPPPREMVKCMCLSTHLLSATYQKAVVFIVISLSNLVREGIEVPGII